MLSCMRAIALCDFGVCIHQHPLTSSHKQNHHHNKARYKLQTSDGKVCYKLATPSNKYTKSKPFNIKEGQNNVCLFT